MREPHTSHTSTCANTADSTFSYLSLLLYVKRGKKIVKKSTDIITRAVHIYMVYGSCTLMQCIIVRDIFSKIKWVENLHNFLCCGWKCRKLSYSFATTSENLISFVWCEINIYSVYGLLLGCCFLSSAVSFVSALFSVVYFCYCVLHWWIWMSCE